MAITSSTEPRFWKTIANLLHARSLSFWALGFVGVVALPAQASSELLGRAAKCSDFYDCFNVMLQSADPRNPEAISVAAARIAEFQKPARGNRKVAREFNTKGLAAFKKGNFAEAVTLLQQASSEDLGDVEVLSNLGLALLKANRAQEARQVLRSSLAINPRRTSAWVPMADVLFEIGDSDSAISSLLLAYEFSENKEKTRSFFDGKAASSERVASLYTQALKKINEPRQVSASVSADPSPTGKRQSLTKSEARAFVIQKVDADPDFRSDPMKKEMMACFMNGALDDIYSGVSSLDKATFENRLSEYADGLKKDDPKAQLRLMKCLVNSPMLEQAMKEKSAEKRPPSSSSSTPLLDMDDLRLDMASLDGKKVRVRGVGHYMMDMFMLKKSMTDMSPMIVDITKLPRDQRREIMNQCSDLMSGCRVTVHGTVGKVSFQKGLFAERVEW
jgi:tetratricopeptide (TPR) repeat protein